jgi:hypothetical protein
MHYAMLWALIPVNGLLLLCYSGVRRGSLPLVELVLIWFASTFIASLLWVSLDGWGETVAVAIAAAIATGIPLVLAAGMFWLAGRLAWTNRTAAYSALGVGLLPALAFPAVGFALVCHFTGTCI